MLVSGYSPNAAPLANGGDMAAIWEAALGTAVVGLMRGVPEVAAPFVRVGLGAVGTIEWPVVLAAGVAVGVSAAVGYYFADEATTSRPKAQEPSPGVISTEEPVPDGGVPENTAAPEHDQLHVWAKPSAAAADKVPEAQPENPPAESTPANDVEADKEAQAEAEIERVRHAPPMFAMPPPANQNVKKGDVSKPFDAYVFYPGELVPTTRELLWHADLEFADPLVRDAVAELRGTPMRPEHVPLSEIDPADPIRAERARRIHEALGEIDARAQQETEEGRHSLYGELRRDLGKYLYRLDALD